MATSNIRKNGQVEKILNCYGRCVELVPLDPNFHEISVSLLVKNGTATVWTFSRKPGVDDRIRQIRDQLVNLGELSPVTGTNNQARFSCGEWHTKPVKFLMMQAVEKKVSYRFPEGEISVKDLKSPLIFYVKATSYNRQHIYSVHARGESPNKTMRIAAVTAGFVRYGEMEKVHDGHVGFGCGQRHDGLMRLLFSYARNVTGSEDMLENAALRGQMTTGTLGFTPPT